MRVRPRLAPTARHLDHIAAELRNAEVARQAQLDALPTATDPVAVAHRDSVRRILDAIRHALSQLAAGTYGDCHRCGARADLDLPTARPWAPLCRACGRR
jgi:DnaK suppressor protein